MGDSEGGVDRHARPCRRARENPDHRLAGAEIPFESHTGTPTQSAVLGHPLRLGDETACGVDESGFEIGDEAALVVRGTGTSESDEHEVTGNPIQHPGWIRRHHVEEILDLRALVEVGEHEAEP